MAVPSDWSCWISTVTEWGKLLAPIVAVLIAYFLGAAAYFRQKEYELVRKRYLEEGVDIISEEADKALGVFWRNWSRALSLLKQFRGLGSNVDRKLYSEGWVTLEPSVLATRPNYRLNLLVRDEIFYSVLQLVHAWVENANKVIVEDLCVAIKLRVEGAPGIQVKAKDEEINKTYMDRLLTLRNEAQRYYQLIHHLENIAGVLEQERLSFKKLRSFHTYPVVTQGIAELKKAFHDDLQAVEESDK